MAIDFGRKRCGIAMTDPLHIAAFVKGYIAREEVERVVVGLPRQLNGQESESMRWLRPAIQRLKREIAPVPVVFFDERFTSVLAHRAMIDGGMPRMARRDKAVVDRISAAIILNDYLNSSAS